MKENVLVSENGIEIYLSDIYEEADRYIASLDAEDDEERKKLMQKPAIFQGMLKTIYMNLFKKGEMESKLNNRGSRVNYDDITVLDELWDTYTLLCYRFNQTPNLLGFSLMIGISRNTIGDWSNGKYKASPERIGTIEKWRTESEQALWNSAATGNPGAMFLLKCCHNYVENRGIYEQGNVLPIEMESPKQIIQRRAEKPPELPNFD